MIAALEWLHQHLATQAGLKLPDWVLSNRVAERIAELGLSRASDYIDLVREQRSELDHLVELLRVGETRFFRHEAQMRAITEYVTGAFSSTEPRRIRVWSAGCATGEEAYTLAIILRKQVPGRFPIEVLASDISNDALRIARRAEYNQAAVESVPARWRDWAFARQGNGQYAIRPEVSDLVTFEQRNLATGPYPREFDLILCRNVLIYFTDEAKRAATRRFIQSLCPSGVLVVGYSESLSGVAGLAPIQVGQSTLYQRVSQDDTPPPANRPRPSPARARPTPDDRTASATDVRPAQRPAAKSESITIELLGHYERADHLSSELAPILAPQCQRATILLDGAAFLGDEAATVLRRVVAAARSTGTPVAIRAKRPSTLRWLTRAGIAAEEDAT